MEQRLWETGSQNWKIYAFINDRGAVLFKPC